MKKFDGILFCTDLDGTLYNDKKEVSRENLDAIEYFKSEGGLFTFITGRVPQTSGQMCEIIKPNAPYGCVNGGGIYDPNSRAFLWNASLDDDFLELVRAVDENLPDVGIQLNTEKAVYFNKDCPAMYPFHAFGLPDLRPHYTEVNEPVLKVLFAHDNGNRINELSELLANHELADKYDFIRSEYTLYEILPKGVSKGTALVKLASLLGIDRSKTIAVGDYNNDVSMISSAGVGFAVKNAVDEAKRVADHITVSNNDHAIAAIVEMLDSGKLKI